MIIEAVKYAVGFIQYHFWAILKMVLVFMAIAIALGMIVVGSSLLLLSALSNNIWLTVALESPLVAVVGFVVYGMWHVSFITYILALERAGVASVVEHLKKSWGLRVPKIILFDLAMVLFMGMIALLLSGAALGAWWSNGMQLLLWHRITLGVLGAVLLVGLLYLLFRLFFTRIIIADTDTDIFTACSTSWLATRGIFLSLLLFAIVMGLITSVITFVASQMAGFIGVIVVGSLGALLGNVVKVFAAIINIVFYPTVWLYYYLQLKVAKSLIAGR